MKLIINKIPRWVKESIIKDKLNIDADKYFVMTEDTDEHVGFMKEKEDQTGEKYFEIVIFDSKVEEELILYKYYKENNN